jgi:hypothetical protein
VAIRKSSLFGIAAALLTGASVYSFYAFSFFAWVTATPASSAQLDQAKVVANAWGLAVLVLLVLAVAAVVGAVRLRRAGV